MSSVTFETSASVSYQDTKSKPAKDDQRSAPDSFASLVDSNINADSLNNRVGPALPDPPVPVQRPDDKPAPADARPARDDNRSSRGNDRSDASSGSDPRDRGDDRWRGDDRKADAGSKADSAGKPAKSNESKQTDKDEPAKTDGDSDTKAAVASDGTTPAVETVPVTAIAVTIPVPTTPATDSSATPMATGNAGATAPLAIAAAALKAQQAVASDEATTTPVDQTAAPTDPTSQADRAMTAAIAAVKPGTAKPTAKAASGATESAAPTKAEAKSNKTDDAATPPATEPSAVVQHTAGKTTGKHEELAGDPAKSDEPGGNAPAIAAPRAHEHATAAAQATAPDPTQPLTNTVQQPQLQPVATIAAPAAQLTATAAGSAAVPLDGVAVEIAANVQRGNSRFEIRLDPAELGRIDIRMDVDRHGQVTSHLTVEKPETLAMLRQDAPQLQRALEDAGLKTGDGGLQFSLRDQSSSGQNNGNDSGRNARRVIVSEEDALPAVVAQRGYGRMLGSNSGVDIRI